MTTLQRSQLLTMLRLQDELNRVVNPVWIDAGYPYLRAAFIEAAEALDHLGWKWWKLQDPNLEQVQIELVDILHFYLSDLLIECRLNHEQATENVMEELCRESTVLSFDGRLFDLDKLDTQQLIELLGGLAVVRRRSFLLLEHLMSRCGMNWDVATVQYVSKNVLNTFRQAHGYKSGTYIKDWNGLEDNEYLSAIVLQLDPCSASFADDLYAALESEYKLLSRT